ncbi:MAG: TonB-dependent receptor plug domain-containing protein [Rhodospirillales bacterium]
MRRLRRGVLSPLLLALALAAPLHVAAADTAPESFSDLSLEELMEVDVVEISSVSRQTRLLKETAGAAFVIGAEDIRRSGAASIPEVLRMVPGVEVARIDANKWAVSIRGFNGRFADKLLVLIDGMSVYTPFFCNVFWDVQDVPLEDIDRIEVIRGPGGSVWGANAVNGVINIITKRAEETQGALLTTIAGSQPSGSATARYGGRIGDDTFYRGYVKSLAQGDSGRPEGSSIVAADAWDQRQAGFRIDSRREEAVPELLPLTATQIERAAYGKLTLRF